VRLLAWERGKPGLLPIADGRFPICLVTSTIKFAIGNRQLVLILNQLRNVTSFRQRAAYHHYQARVVVVARDAPSR
jgi:hypothetical protein